MWLEKKHIKIKFHHSHVFLILCIEYVVKCQFGKDTKIWTVSNWQR